MPKDWIFSDEKSICHFRVAGVLIRDNKVFYKESRTSTHSLGGM